MAIKSVVTGTNNRALRKISRNVKTISYRTKKLLDDMIETMHVEQGVGLAAPQIGVLRRMAVIEYEDQRYEIINPRIVEQSGEAIAEEGCLSVEGIRGLVKRPKSITVVYTDREGKVNKKEMSGIMARIFCHEIDHLDGVLFVDKMIEETE